MINNNSEKCAKMSSTFYVGHGKKCANIKKIVHKKNSEIKNDKGKNNKHYFISIKEKIY